MGTDTYDMYRRLGWTSSEIWSFASEMEHCDDGIGIEEEE